MIHTPIQLGDYAVVATDLTATGHHLPFGDKALAAVVFRFTATNGTPISVVLVSESEKMPGHVHGVIGASIDARRAAAQTQTLLDLQSQAPTATHETGEGIDRLGARR